MFCRPSRENLPTAFLQQRDRISIKKAHSQKNALFYMISLEKGRVSGPGKRKRASEKDACCFEISAFVSVITIQAI